MKKQEKIHQAWGKFPMVNYDKDNGFAISYCINGVTDILDDPYGKIEWEHLEADLIKWRPIELKGIENNNGWIKIESEDDLPIYTTLCHVQDYELNIGVTNLYKNKGFLSQYTHYQPIIKPQPPIY